MANSSFYSGTGTNPTDVDSITSSKTAAETAATNAATSEANAATSATNAAASATNASNSASSISGSVAAAASSATDSANSATSSSTSATQAATSASNAAASATSASTSAASATSSASSSADSALDASGSATAAASSATSASTSASNAATSEANAATSASQAATSASTAQAAATNTDVATVSSNVSYVQTVADNISDVETVSNNVLKINTVADNISDVLGANTASTQAISSAADAASSATQAASSATSAATSASTATAAKDAALEALDNFDDRYLGQKASDPTVDNDGDALVAGALYFDTTTDTMKVYDGSIWVAAYASLSGALIAANNLSDVTDAATSRTNLGLGTAATTASTDYATAAQGTLADTSVQPNDSPTFAGLTTTADVSFGDNDKAIFGADSDLQIYHDGDHSYIRENGTGSLFIQSNNNGIVFEKTDGENIGFIDTVNSRVVLYNGGNQKLATTSTGVDITGTVTADGLTVTNTATNIVLQRENSFLPYGGIEVQSENLGTTYYAGSIGNYNGQWTISTQTTSTTSNPIARAAFAANGDISFYEDTGTTAKFFWDASAESLGIGTSAINGTLDIANSDQTNGVTLSLTNSFAGSGWTAGDTIGTINFRTDDASTTEPIRGQIKVFDDATVSGTYAGNNAMSFSTGYINALYERMRIDSSGNVGIGKTSPSQILHIKDTGTNTVVIIEGSTTGGSFVNFADSDDTNIGQIGYDHTSNYMQFRVNDAERMRIDSSGNLLVGKTSANTYNTTAGFETRPDGLTSSTRDGAISLILNRLTSDGDIAVFRKDGITVGSIGTEGGDLYIGTTDTALSFVNANDAIVPFHATSVTRRDASIDFGSSSYRFKDLYLSGGIYLGGTGSANKLDDYEEGTWTPTLPNGGTLTVGSSAKYRKVGNVVTVSAYLSSINPTANTSQFRIGGLPFASDSTVDYYSGGSFGYVGQNNLSDVLLITGVGFSYIYFHENDGTPNVISNNTMRSKGLTGDAADAMIFTLTYFT